MQNNNIIVYLHGFRSSPQSFKAQLCAQRAAKLKAGDRYICPQLPASPKDSIQLLLSLLSPFAPEQITLVGSSLGGYYATWLAEKLGARAVLLNPMTGIPTNMAQFLGATTTFHTNEPFEFKPEYVDDLRALKVERITHPERYWLIAATGDELLDWREMVAHYPGAKQTIIEGSDHGLTGFEQYLDEVLAYGGIDAGGISTNNNSDGDTR
ncbi:MAG: putative alpha/beta-hydrolase [Burkholderiaceae bacterium]|nr:putative alpha/beta-hydrolase [Burkholderiaceae bacterium]